MTRRFLALFAPSLLAAQVDIEIQNGRIVKRTPRIPRPRNGECPLCGTMAKPYSEGFGSTQDAYYDGSKFGRLAICDHCGCTFRQWAQGKEPKR